MWRLSGGNETGGKGSSGNHEHAEAIVPVHGQYIPVDPPLQNFDPRILNRCKTAGQRGAQSHKESRKSRCTLLTLYTLAPNSVCEGSYKVEKTSAPNPQNMQEWRSVSSEFLSPLATKRSECRFSTLVCRSPPTSHLPRAHLHSGPHSSFHIVTCAMDPCCPVARAHTHTYRTRVPPHPSSAHFFGSTRDGPPIAPPSILP